MIYLIYITLILKTFLLSWFIITFEPIQTYIVGTLEGINLAIFNNTKSILIYIIGGYIIKPLTCHMCCGFWTGLILSGNIYVGIATSVISYHYDKIKGNQKIKL